MKQSRIIIIAIAAVLFILQACKTKPPSGGDIIRIEDEPDDTLVIIPEPVDTINFEDTVVTSPTKEYFKDEYRIALVLPIMEDSIKTSWNLFNEVDYNDFYFPKTADRALSFLEGWLIAAEEIEGKAKFDIHLYDNKGTTAGTIDVVKDLEKDSFDIVIGGIAKTNVMELATFAKEFDIPYFSPFSVSQNITENNPNYFMLEATLNLHLQTMVNYAIDSMPNAHIKVFYEDTKLGEQLARIISDHIDMWNEGEQNIAKKVKYSLVEVSAKASDRRNFKIGEHLDEQVENVVIIPSFSDGFVHAMLTQLNSRTVAYDFVTFGMPNWEDSETIRLEYLNTLHVHVTKSSYLQDTREAERFLETYKEVYKKKATNDACLGYDLMNYLNLFVNEEGTNFAGEIANNPYKGIVKNLSFEKVLNMDSVVQRYENTFVHILKYEDFEPTLVK